MTKECAECLEQARLLGMSAERELALMAEIGRLERKVAHLEKTCADFGVVPARAEK